VTSQRSTLNAPTPRAVIFDLGKVLLDFSYERCARNLATRSTASVSAIRELLDQSPLLFRLETGLLSSTEFFSQVRSAIGFRGELADFAPLFGDIFSPLEPMIALHARLRGEGVPAFIFSNTNDFAVRHIRATYPFFSEFDGYVYSHEQGAMKPAAKIYEAVEALSGLRGADLLYIDDRAENIAAGAERGWRTVLHHDPEATRRAVASALAWAGRNQLR